ncbi:hypothetical protein QE152_g35813 [Popillia japonica]|uniref:Uncharacterized protein n=1 Tax=Popillia japonica TaxID=7064 RepID=A0AAW1IEB5_POPJA
MEWRKPKEPASRKAKTDRLAGIHLAALLWRWRDTLLVDFLHERLLPIGYQRVVVFHDKCLVTHSCINPRKIGSDLLDNTGTFALYPYLFGPLKEELRSDHCNDKKVLEKFVRNWIQTRSYSLMTQLNNFDSSISVSLFSLITDIQPLWISTLAFVGDRQTNDAFYAS